MTAVCRECASIPSSLQTFMPNMWQTRRISGTGPVKKYQPLVFSFQVDAYFSSTAGESVCGSKVTLSSTKSLSMRVAKRRSTRPKLLDKRKREALRMAAEGLGSFAKFIISARIQALGNDIVAH